MRLLAQLPVFFFFFQAEDGIRDYKVTGVQTCALPICICAAQSEGAKSAAEQPKYFHLDFVVKEMDSGKVINARHYSTMIATGESTPYNCTIQIGRAHV